MFDRNIHCEGDLKRKTILNMVVGNRKTPGSESKSELNNSV